MAETVDPEEGLARQVATEFLEMCKRKGMDKVPFQHLTVSLQKIATKLGFENGDDVPLKVLETALHDWYVSSVSTASTGDTRESIEKKSGNFATPSKSFHSTGTRSTPCHFQSGGEWQEIFKSGKEWQEIDIWLNAIKRVLATTFEDMGRNTKDAQRIPLRLAVLHLLSTHKTTEEELRRRIPEAAKKLSKKVKQNTLDKSLALLPKLPGVKVWSDIETGIQYYELSPEMKKLIYSEYLVLKTEKEGPLTKFDAGRDREERIAAFITFFREYRNDKGEKVYINELSRLITELSKKSLEVDWVTLHAVAPNLANQLLLEPEGVINDAESALVVVLREDLLLTSPPKMHVRFYNLPNTYDVRRVGPELINRFVQVRGIISQLSSIEPFVRKAVFVCTDCGNEMVRLQRPFSLVMNKPLRCDACGSRNHYLDDDKSTFIRYQSAHIQDFPEELKGGQMPAHLTVVFQEDLTDRVLPGDRVILTGVLKRVEEKRDDKPVKKLVLIVNHIEKENEDAEEVDIRPEEEQEFRKEAQREDFVDRLVASFAPSIHGHDVEKKGLLLSLFGGNDYKTVSGEYVRSRSHILLAGDPGVSKSDLLKFARSIAPRAVYASGKSMSGAGLTASAVKNELTGKWTIEAGTLVLADKGFAIIDELDKARKEDRDALHEPMEQGVIGFSKAGISADVNARATVLAAANPRYGKLSPNKTVLEQMDLPDTLISRFDMIFGFWDRPDEKTDYEIAKKIGQRRFHSDKISAPYSQEWLKKYIAYARKKYPSPLQMSEEVQDYISKQYVKLRRKYGNTLTARFADGLYRLAEAHARMHLREKVLKADANAVIELMEYMFQSIATNEDGEVDATILEVGKSSVKLRRLERLTDIIKKLEDTDKWGARIEDVVEEGRMAGLGTEHEVRELLKELKEGSDIYEPRKGYVRVVR